MKQNLTDLVQKNIRILLFILVALLAPFLSNTAHAQGRFLVFGDNDYLVTDTPRARYIYPAEYRPLMTSLHHYNQLFHNVYEKEFNWVLDEKETLVLASSHNQIANGFATVLPKLHSVYYGASGEFFDEFSVQSWLHVLLVHETAHLYQLNTKQGYSVFLKSLFGNSNIDASAFLPPFTYSMNPNIFLPTFVLEGNATYNEGRFGNGGRLYNGAIRGLFLQLVRDDLITPERLMNDHLDFPYAREKYWVGGYFFLDVAENSNAAQPNQYYLKHADHNANPLQVNDPMLATYGNGYLEIIKRMKNRWHELAKQQAHANEATLFNSDSHTALTKDENEIRILTATNKSLPIARIYNLKNKSWSEQKINVPMGRLFRNKNGELVSTGSEAVSVTSIRSGLYRAGFKPEKEFFDKTVYDLNSAGAIWADAKNSFISPRLYVNDKFIAEAASSAILQSGAVTSQSGAANSPIDLVKSAENLPELQKPNVYYFKQKNKTRTLYRNETPLYSYQGYFGYPVDAIGDAVYFIGPVAAGSTVFAVKGKNIQRVTNSDIVIDAKLIDEQNLLITEFKTTGYEYKIVTLQAVDKSPDEYSYFYEKEENFKMFDNYVAEQNTSTAGDTNHDSEEMNITKTEKPYHSLRDLQFDGIDPMIFFGVDTFAVAQATIRYSDPLQNNQLGLLLGSGSFGEMTGGAFYRNTKNPFNWDIFGIYQKRAKVEENLSVEASDPDRYRILDRYDTWLASTGFDYLFYRRPQWFSTLSSHFIYEYEHPHIALADIDKTYTLLTSLNWGHVVAPPLAYSAYRQFYLSADHEYIHTAPDWVDQRNIFGAQIYGAYDVFSETYVSAMYQKAIADGSNAIVPLEFGPSDLPYTTSTRVQRNTSHPDIDYFSVSKVALELKQALNWSYYFTRLPFSLRRLALIGQYNEYYAATRPRGDEDTLFHETGGGAEFEVLFIHRFPLRMRLMHYQSNFRNEETTLFTMGINGVQ